MAGGDGFERGLELGVGVDPVHFGRFDETGDARPGRWRLRRGRRTARSCDSAPAAGWCFPRCCCPSRRAGLSGTPAARPNGWRYRRASRPAATSARSARAAFAARPPKSSTSGAVRAWRSASRTSGGSPRICFSIAYMAAVRRLPSAAIVERWLSWTSHSLRRACAHQKHRTTPLPGAATAL